LPGAPGELGAQNGGHLARAGAGAGIGRTIVQALALRLEVAQLDEQEVILAQRESHLFGCPAQELQELIVGQQMPVAADDRQRGPALLFHGDPRRPCQAHAPAQAHNLAGGGSDDLRHPSGGHQLPVAPDKRVQAIGKVREGHRLGGVAAGEVGCAQAGFCDGGSRPGPAPDQSILCQSAASQCQGSRLEEGSAIKGPACVLQV